jgi:hypothetical protein
MILHVRFIPKEIARMGSCAFPIFFASVGPQNTFPGKIVFWSPDTSPSSVTPISFHMYRQSAFFLFFIISQDRDEKRGEDPLTWLFDKTAGNDFPSEAPQQQPKCLVMIASIICPRMGSRRCPPDGMTCTAWSGSTGNAALRFQKWVRRFRQATFE